MPVDMVSLVDSIPSADVVVYNQMFFIPNQKRELSLLDVQAFGLVKLPAGFKKLGKSLESLNLVSNNFNRLSDITKVVNAQNFPHLTELILYAQRRSDVCINMSGLNKNSDGNYIYNTYPIGMYGNISSEYSERQAFLSLLTWDNLRALELSYCFLEGELPTDEEMDEALEAVGKPTRYTAADFSTNKAGCHVVHGVGPVPVHPVLHLSGSIVVLILLQVVDEEVYVERISSAEA